MKHRQKVPCSICGKVLKSIVALKNHEDKHVADALPESETKKFSCDLCGMKFRLKCYVFNHMNNVHLRNKYPCEFCGKGFYKKYEKMEHVVRMHTNERPIACEFEGCGKTFARQKNYNIHKVSAVERRGMVMGLVVLIRVRKSPVTNSIISTANGVEFSGFWTMGSINDSREP